MLHKTFFSLTLSLVFCLASVVAQAGLVTGWSVERPNGLVSTGSSAITHNNGASAIWNPTLDEFGGVVNASVSQDDTRYFHIELDVTKFIQNGADGSNYVVVSFKPDTASDYILGLGNVNLFGEDFQSIISDGNVDLSNSFYFDTSNLFTDENSNKTIAFDILLRGVGNTDPFSDSWTINVETAYVPGKEPIEPTTPEPATMLIFGLGLAGLGLVRRRMRK